MLLSNKVNYDTIHDYPRDIRNRIDALFMVDNASSWKCITKECAMVPPLNTKVRDIYDFAVNEIENNEEYKCDTFIKTFCDAPYGLSEETAIMFMGMILVNIWHNARVLFDSNRTTINDWKDSIVADKKIDINAFRDSTILWVDTGSVEAKFQRIFQQIDNCHSIADAEILRSQLQDMIDYFGLPESLDAHKRLADRKFLDFDTAKRSWDNRIGSIQDDLEIAQRTHNVYKAITCIENVQNMPLSHIFTEGIEIPEECREIMLTIRKAADTVINDYFDSWLLSSVYCQSVEKMRSFERFYTDCRDRLEYLGYFEQARKIDAKGKAELKNKEEIKSRQDLIEDGKRFISDCKKTSKNNYPVLKSLVKTADSIENRFRKYGDSLGRDAVITQKEVAQYAAEIKKQKARIDDAMASVFDIVAEADTVDAIGLATDCLATVLGYILSDKDRYEFLQLQGIIEQLNSDINTLQSEMNRNLFEKEAHDMINKYRAEDCEYDFIPVIEDCISTCRNELDKKDSIWKSKNLTLKSKTRQDVFEWKQHIEVLPPYLTKETIEEIKVLDQEADQIISDGKIEDVVYYYKKLDCSERKKCLAILVGLDSENTDTSIDYSDEIIGNNCNDSSEEVDALEDMLSLDDLTRRINVRKKSLKKYIREGDIVPDMVIASGAEKPTLFFKPERVKQICDEFDWTEITDDNRKDIFIENISRMQMDHSYKPVFLLAFFDHMDYKGCARKTFVVESFSNFYKKRKKEGLVVEKSSSILLSENCNQKNVEQLMISNPFKVYEEMGVMSLSSNGNMIELDRNISASLTLRDINSIKKTCLEGIRKYYSQE